jgi:NAD-dependent dihydropyrimidine dehydrogenase PreA subunit
MVSVVVDHEKCTGDAVCVSVCPVNVFEMQDVGGAQKAVVPREDDCIACMACTVSCPENAITVEE